MRRIGFVLSLTGAWVFLLLTALPAAAATRTVCASGCDFTTIADAINDGGTADGDVISVQDAVHTEEDITVDKSVTIDGGGNIVQAAAPPATASTRIFEVEAGHNVTITNITLQYGRGSRGGAVRNSGVLTITDSMLISNTARSFSGGAVYNNADATLHVISSTFTANTSTTGGGAIRSEGEMLIANSLFQQNAAGSSGGAIRNKGEGSAVAHLTISNTRIISNTANAGGGGIRNGNIMTITDSIIANNSAATDGGAIRNVSNGVANIGNTIISGNQSTLSGGGIRNAGNLNLNQVIIFDNLSESRGGAIRNASGIANIANTLIFSNTASGSGGAIDSEGELNVSNSTIAANVGDTGTPGGIFSSASATRVDNSILTANSNEECELINSATMTGTNNLIDDTTCTGLAQLGMVTNINTTTWQLELGSNAIDTAANPCVYASGGMSNTLFMDGETIMVDLRGSVRAGGANPNDERGGTLCDIGAYEFNSTFTPSAVTIQSVTTQQAGASAAVSLAVVLALVAFTAVALRGRKGQSLS